LRVSTIWAFELGRSGKGRRSRISTRRHGAHGGTRSVHPPMDFETSGAGRARCGRLPSPNRERRCLSAPRMPTPPPSPPDPGPTRHRSSGRLRPRKQEPPSTLSQRKPRGSSAGHRQPGEGGLPRRRGRCTRTGNESNGPGLGDLVGHPRPAQRFDELDAGRGRGADREHISGGHRIACDGGNGDGQVECTSHCRITGAERPAQGS